MNKPNEPMQPPGGLSLIVQRAKDAVATPASLPGWATRVPARLDVLGGFAEYSESSLIGFPVSEGVAVTARTRADDLVVVHGVNSSGSPQAKPLNISRSDCDIETSEMFVADLPKTDWLAAAAGAVYAVHAQGKVSGERPGLDLTIDIELSPCPEIGLTVAVAVAVLRVLAECWQFRMDPFECATLATQIENVFVGFPSGVGTALSMLHGRCDGFTRISTKDGGVEGQWPIVPGLSVVGIDCGFRCPKRLEKYTRARTAAFMGRVIVERVLSAPDAPPVKWGRSLASITTDDFVEHLRHRIPTRIKGADFLNHFGETADPLTTVDPSTVYKVRSRTEHHVYESERVDQFVKLYKRFCATNDRDALSEIGKLMYASHWSYGQRSGLGSVETDHLYGLLRERGGKGCGIYGARVSAQGAGGVVVALIDDKGPARAAVDEAVREYESQTGHRTAFYAGSSQGALEYGVHRID